MDRVAQLAQRVDRLEGLRRLARDDDLDAIGKLETSLDRQQQVTGSLRNLWMELQASHNNLVNRLAQTERDVQA